jgi:23S rRNA (uracil1939-C5)-methyltransferase
LARSGKAKAPRRAPPPTRCELLVAAVGARGDGVVHAEGGDIYVPYTLAGERIVASVSGDRGRVEEILAPSPLRVAPPCPHFGACGGCALQHMREDAYRNWKRQRVIEALARVGIDTVAVDETVAIEVASRRRATFIVERSSAGVSFAFHERASHRALPFESCEILHPDFLTGLAGAKRVCAALPPGWRRFRLAATLYENGFDIDLTGATAPPPEGETLARLAATMDQSRLLRLSIDAEPLLALNSPIVRFADVPVTPPPGAFLQASAAGEQAIVAHVLEGARDARRALDLFAGCGALSLPLSRAATVFAVDSDRNAIAALDAAARRSPHRPLTAEARNLFERPVRPEELREYDCVVFDPPRAGARAQAECLAGGDVPVVVAVSCNPATFARDATVLLGGGYALRRVTPIDQFAYSAHVELVAIFDRRRP